MLVLMSDVTRILSQIEQGDPSAADQLLPLVYNEFGQLAAAKLARDVPTVRGVTSARRCRLGSGGVS